MATKINKAAATEEEVKATFDNAFAHLAEDGMGGFEGLDASVMAFPFIKILQQLSPQLDETKPEYVDGAKQGMFHNSVTNEVFSAPTEVIVGKFEHYFIEWKPERGGYAGAHAPEDVASMLSHGELERDERNRLVSVKTGNIYADTYVYFVVFPERMEDGVCLLSLSSTQLKEARRWNRLLVQTYIPGTGRRALPYHMRWTLTTPPMQNDRGSWRGIKVELAGFVSPEQLQIVSEERKTVTAVNPDLRLLEAGAEDYDGTTYDVGNSAEDTAF